jgi:hypothetical protein
MSKKQDKIVEETMLKLGYHIRHVLASAQLGCNLQL